MEQDQQLPEFFRPVLWSYDFAKITPQKNRRTIIVNSINYGDLRHWRWIIRLYGKKNIAELLSQMPATELRIRARRLVSIIFNIKKFNYAPRGVK